MSAARRAFVLLLAALVLTGCGYRLRGEAELPAAMAQTVLEAPRTGTGLERQLGLILRSNGVELVERGEAGAVLEILEDRLTRDVLSVGATARVREFSLQYVVRFRLRDAQGRVLIPEQRLELTDDYQYDQQQVLGTTSEEEQIRKDLVRTMALQLLRRLEFAAPS